MTWGVRNLRVRYGSVVALDDVTLDVVPGAVTAVVGGDGAGKSTLCKVLTGVLAGDGVVRRPQAARIGAMTEVPGVWTDLTVEEHVRFSADVYGLLPAARDDRAAHLLGRAGLGGARDRLAGDLSGGMRQKLAVVLALLHRPDLLVLDEPTTGVDPVSRAELWRLIGHATAEGAAVLLTTTYLDEAERAVEVLALHAGRTLLRGDPAALAAGRRLEDVVIERQRDVREPVP